MILYIDACARKNSRTRELADALLNILSKDDSDLEKINLYEQELQPITQEIISKRDSDLSAKDFSDSYYALAKQLAAADTVIIATPYWDLSFASILKTYLENISVNGITFYYDENGIPHGLCKADKLYYVTTSGGIIGDNNFGFDYVKALTTALYGVKEALCIKAEGLDLVGNDAARILAQAKAQL